MERLAQTTPVRYLWTAAQDLWPEGHLEDKIKCIVSIGTGVPAVEAFGKNMIDVGKTLLAISTDTETTAELFLQEHRTLANRKRYFRFNVEHGLEHIGLEDKEKQASIVAATRAYLESQVILEQMTACGKELQTRQGWWTYA